jgi:hypothetical protein
MRPHSAAISRGVDREPGGAQVFGQQPTQRWVVADHQHARTVEAAHAGQSAVDPGTSPSAMKHAEAG